jgi:hypothetical protein
MVHRRIVVVSISFMSCLNAGCSIYGVPSLNHGVLMRTPPQVVDLVNHVNCEIAQAMLKQPKDSLWHYLWDDNFVASVDLTLLATNVEGFNPSVNWIVPTNTLGKEVSLPPPMPGQTGMSSMFNRGLAVGIQANGTQDRNFDVTYNIDMTRLHATVRRAALAASLEKPPVAPNLSSICGEEKSVTGSASKKAKATYSGLQGELGLQNTIDWGLDAINAGRIYGVYGNSGPVTRGDENTAPPHPRRARPKRFSWRALAPSLLPAAARPRANRAQARKPGAPRSAPRLISRLSRA